MITARKHLCSSNGCIPDLATKPQDAARMRMIFSPGVLLAARQGSTARGGHGPISAVQHAPRTVLRYRMLAERKQKIVHTEPQHLQGFSQLLQHSVAIIHDVNPAKTLWVGARAKRERQKQYMAGCDNEWQCGDHCCGYASGHRGYGRWTTRSFLAPGEEARRHGRTRGHSERRPSRRGAGRAWGCQRRKAPRRPTQTATAL
jgi:hypothetical protein